MLRSIRLRCYACGARLGRVRSASAGREDLSRPAMNASNFVPQSTSSGRMPRWTASRWTSLGRTRRASGFLARRQLTPREAKWPSTAKANKRTPLPPAGGDDAQGHALAAQDRVEPLARPTRLCRTNGRSVRRLAGNARHPALWRADCPNGRTQIVALACRDTGPSASASPNRKMVNHGPCRSSHRAPRHR